MKIRDIENIQNWLNDIKKVADMQSYNISSDINNGL